MNPGRGLMPRGEDHWKAKLTASKVRRMRYLVEEKGYTPSHAHLTVAPGVHYQTACAAIYGHNWAHID